MYFKDRIKRYAFTATLAFSSILLSASSLSKFGIVYASETSCSMSVENTTIKAEDSDDKTDIIKAKDGSWYYTYHGKPETKFTGFARNQNGWWYCRNGKVDFSVNDIIKGTVAAESAWWLVKNGKVQFTDTIEKNASGWWYIKSGRVDFSYTGLAKNQNGWWFCRNGKVDFSFNDFAENQYGWWFCRNGKVDLTANGIIKGTVSDQPGWWLVKNGKVQFTDTIERNSLGWWCIKNGRVDFSYTGLAKNQNGWWYCENGKVDFSKTTVLKGTVNDTTGWYNVESGKVTLDQKSCLGKNDNGTWYCENGRVTFKYSGYYVNNNTTYIYKNSKLDNVTNSLLPLTKLPGYYVSPMYAGNLNSSDERIEAMIKRAYDYLNAQTKYKICTSKKPGESVDCSGLVMQCLYAAGFDPYPATPAHHALPENEYDSRTLWSSVNMKHINVKKSGGKYITEKNIDKTKLKRGDLIFYANTEYNVINHVAIYLGDGKVIEAVEPYVLDYLGLFHDIHETIYGVARPFE